MLKKPLNFLFVVFGIALHLGSCDFTFRKDSNVAVLARVNEKVLTWEEIRIRGVEIPNDSLDSVQVVNRFVNRWVKDQLLLQRAEFNLTEQQKQFDLQIEDYRRDLMIFAYQQAFLSENLDTIIDQEEINRYYDENRSQFLLKENIFRVEYAVFPNDVPNLRKIENLFFSNKENDREELFDIAVQAAQMYFTDDTIWMNFNELMRELPVIQGHSNEFLVRKNKLRFSDDLYVYFINILEYKLKESEAPMTYVERSIRSILMNKRRLEILEKLEQKIFKDGITKNVAEIY